MFARFIAVVVVSSTVLAGAASAADKRPNIVMILADNLGKDWFGCYGADGNHTPNVDKLAVGGTRFRHCWSTALCSTTRVELWTGRYPFHTGWTIHHDAAIYGGGYLDWRRETSLARVMQAGGYSTCITGKWQINDLYEQTEALKQHGFDEHFVWTGALLGEGTAEPRWKKQGDSHHEFESRYWGPVVFNNGKREEYPGRFGPDVYVDRLVDFMARHRDRPFFAYYSCPLVHVPTIPTPDTPAKDALEREQFAGMVHYMDKQVGRIVSELERLGLRE
ncbi:MAG TPA: sulfatase-like hydrolase/transferase, partial [Pirellulales bacterium]|nr:sulfatase-like hydrolase/transferase [Pirellulales bacterium]